MEESSSAEAGAKLRRTALMSVGARRARRRRKVREVVLLPSAWNSFVAARVSAGDSRTAICSLQWYLGLELRSNTASNIMVSVPAPARARANALSTGSFSPFVHRSCGCEAFRVFEIALVWTILWERFLVQALQEVETVLAIREVHVKPDWCPVIRLYEPASHRWHPVVV